MTQEQENTITDTDVIQVLAVDNFRKQNDINTKELSLTDKIILVSYLEQREKTILKTISYYEPIIKSFINPIEDNVSLVSTINKLRESINFHNYYGWKYLMNINELRLVSLDRSIRIEIEQIKF